MPVFLRENEYRVDRKEYLAESSREPSSPAESEGGGLHGNVRS